MKAEKINKITLIIAILFLVMTGSFAQESNCSNGLDDDNDGRVDCYDDDCKAEVACVDFYLNFDATCEAKPDSFPRFNMKLFKKSDRQTTSNDQSLVVGDLDGDGIAEIVSLNSYTDRLYIVRGEDLTIQAQTPYNGGLRYAPVIANLNSDNCSEIFIPSSNKISKFDCNLNLLGEIPIQSDPGFMGIADFNNDGTAELYVRDAIYNAETLAQIFASDTPVNGQLSINSGPVAVDIVGDKKLELVSGGTIYNIDIAGGTKTVAQTLPRYFVKTTGKNWAPNNSSTSVADYNQDGYLDVICSGALDSINGPTTVFFWDVQNNTSQHFVVPFDWALGTSRLNIADIDGDGQLNVTFVSRKHLYALDENWNQMWSKLIVESASGITGTTIFDFNGDGKFETVYRDEQYLYIIDGDGITANIPIDCKSKTLVEYPIVADINGDGATEICVVCSADGYAWDDQAEGEIRTYHADGQLWVPSRPVWNQHGYFNVNVKDDLTIPMEQTKQQAIFSNFLCDTLDASGNPIPGAVRPLNTFLNQSPKLDNSGCPNYATPDLTLDDSSIKILPPTCPDNEFYISFDILNNGDLAIDDTLNVSFYDGDPLDPSTNFLNTSTYYIQTLNPGNRVTVDSMLVIGKAQDFTLYIRLNDPNTILECDNTNNLFSRMVNILPFNISTEILSHNDKCYDSIPDNGKASAFVMKNGVKEFSDYEFTWFKDNGGSIDSVFTGSTNVSMGTDTYYITAKHIVEQCGSDTAQVEILLKQDDIDSLSVYQTNIHDDCLNPNGALKLEVWERDISGTYQNVTKDPAINYNFTWWSGPMVYGDDIVSISDSVTNLIPYTYAVLVENPINGCIKTSSGTITSSAEYPRIDSTQSSPLTKCGPNPDGAIEAFVSQTDKGTSLNKNDVYFRWYEGSDTTSVKILGEDKEILPKLDTGVYSTVAILKSNGCSSLIATDSVFRDVQEPIFALQVDAPQTSCDPNRPNGQLSIASSSAGPHNIKWFEGQNTINQIAVNENSMDSLSAGWYTVVLKHNASTCETAQEIYLKDSLTYPVVSNINIDKQNITSCDLTVTDGSIWADYDGSTAGYIFKWSNGINANSPPQFTGNSVNGYQYLNITSGYYTVVVMDEATLCESPPKTDSVALIPDPPVISASVVQTATSCTPTFANGEIMATASSITEPANGYKFEFFRGPNELAGNSVVSINNQDGATGLSANSLAGNTTYRIAVTNETTTCKSTLDQFLNNVETKPGVTLSNLSISDNSNCSAPGNGVIDASAAVSTPAPGVEPVNGYTYHWFDAAGNPLSETGPVLSNLMEGDYQLSVTNNDTKCSSPLVVATVGNNSVAPAASFTIDQEQTACIGENGQLTLFAATASGEPTGGYQMEWFNNSFTSLLAENNAGSSQMNNLNSQTYYGIVTNLDSRCTDTTSIFLPENLTYPRIDKTVAVVTDDEYCLEPGNGTIDATNSPYMVLPKDPATEPVAGYSFQWSNADGFAATTAAINSLSAGTYELTVRNNDTQCESAPVNFNIVKVNVPPLVNITTLNDQTSCSTDPNDHNGSLMAEGSDGSGFTSAGYNFAWFRGQSISTADSITNTSMIDGLTDITYTVKVTDQTTGCQSTAEQAVQTTINYPVPNATAEEATQCSPFDGEVLADVGGIQTGHSFYWYEGESTKTTEDYLGANWTGLEPGKYAVMAYVDSTQCWSQNPYIATVADSTDAITLNGTIINIPSDCSTNDGEVIAFASTANGNTDFTFYWEWNNTPHDTVSSTSGMDYQANLYYGFYNVMVSNNADGCEKDTTFFLPYGNLHSYDSLVLVDSSNVNYCEAPFDGEIAAGVVVDSAQAVYGHIIYNYSLYEGYHTIGDGKTALQTVSFADTTAAPVFSGLGAGVYTVMIEDVVEGNGCFSYPMVIELLQQSADPVASITASNNYSCDPSNPNGYLAATATTSTGDPAGYTFSWYLNDTTAANFIGNGTYVTADSTFQAGLAENSSGENYVLRAYNNQSRCDTIMNQALQLNQRDLTFASATATDQTNCAPANGTLGTGDVLEDGVVDPAFTYSLQLYDQADMTTELAASNSGAGNLVDPFNSLTAASYQVIAVNDSTACEASISRQIVDVTVDPLIVASSLVNDIYCDDPMDPLFGSGSIDGAVDESATGGSASELAGYNFTWYRGADTLNAANQLQPAGYATAHQAFDLSSGAYTIKTQDTDASNQNLNCISVRTFNILEDNPDIVVSTIDKTNQTDCSAGNGSIEITGINYDGTADALANYTLKELYDVNKLSLSTGNPYSSLDSGYYFLRVQHDVTKCFSPYKGVKIDKVITPPSIVFSQIPDWSCNTNGKGELSADVYENGVLFNPDYSFTWEDNANNPIGSTNSLANLVEGQYHVTIVDNTSPGLGCVFTRSTTLNDVPKNITISDHGITDQNICLPNGAVVVNEVSENNVYHPAIIYDNSLYDASFNAIANAGNGVQFNDLAAGTYYLTSRNTDTDCISDTLQVLVDDISIDPLAKITVLSIQRSKAPPATPTGSLIGEARETDGSVDTYDFTWFHESDSTATGFVVTDHTITDQPGGTFTLKLRNTVTNCSTQVTSFVQEDIPAPEIMISSTPTTICAPGDGTISVTDISINSNPEALSSYYFHWYRNDTDPGSLITTTDGANAGGNTLNGLTSGTYFVIVEEKTLALQSLPVQVEIEDNSTLPVIDLVLAIPQTSYNPDINQHNGALTITVDGNTTNTNYEVQWYRGIDIFGTLLSSNNDQFTATGLTDGLHTVWVRNTVTNCESIVLLEVEKRLTPLKIFSSSAPNTHCVDPNGRASANVDVRSNNRSTYTYYWYVDPPLYPSGTPDFTGNLLNSGLNGDTYYVVAVDDADNYRYAVDTVQVNDILRYPDVVLSQINPQRNCYIDRPTGQLMAEITNDDISFYFIEWYQLPDEDNSIGTGNILTKLPVASYKANATHLITGCEDDSESIDVMEEIAPVPPPDVKVINHLTHCETPNGQLNASINNVYYNHNFNWYFGSQVSNSPDFSGPVMDDLDQGDYAVTATDKKTGCISNATVVAVLDKRVYPAFDVIVENETCKMKNGSAYLQITNGAAANYIEWDDGYLYSYGPSILNQSAGDYSVTVNTIYECIATQDFTIGSNIRIFNGISDNGDGANDWFVVDCIEEFWNNNVKIYNRSGDLVYETNNYDNDVNHFNGRGNKGIYLDNGMLPIGTYYYVIDLKDGNVPQTGYLELVR